VPGSEPHEVPFRGRSAHFSRSNPRLRCGAVVCVCGVCVCVCVCVFALPLSGCFKQMHSSPCILRDAITRCLSLRSFPLHSSPILRDPTASCIRSDGFPLLLRWSIPSLSFILRGLRGFGFMLSVLCTYSEWPTHSLEFILSGLCPKCEVHSGVICAPF
jgi:hypothetical protein